jgi:hypothetical protein
MHNPTIKFTIEKLLERKPTAPVQKTENTAVGIRHADHAALYGQKLSLTSPTSDGSSVSIVRSLRPRSSFKVSLHANNRSVKVKQSAHRLPRLLAV